MITLEIARKLKAAGLVWAPALHDFFAVPERGMDDRLFVISDMQVNVENLFGSPVVAFQGVSEWALDYLVSTEAVWIPTEEQLRSLLEENLLSSLHPRLQLTWSMNEGYRLELSHRGKALSFSAAEAAQAYAEGLLYLLENEMTAGEG